jgi:hypothetical protein
MASSPSRRYGGRGSPCRCSSKIYPRPLARGDSTSGLTQGTNARGWSPGSLGRRNRGCKNRLGEQTQGTNLGLAPWGVPQPPGPGLPCPTIRTSLLRTRALGRVTFWFEGWPRVLHRQRSSSLSPTCRRGRPWLARRAQRRSLLAGGIGPASRAGRGRAPVPTWQGVLRGGDQTTGAQCGRLRPCVSGRGATPHLGWAWVRKPQGRNPARIAPLWSPGSRLRPAEDPMCCTGTPCHPRCSLSGLTA